MRIHIWIKSSGWVFSEEITLRLMKTKWWRMGDVSSVIWFSCVYHSGLLWQTIYLLSWNKQKKKLVSSGLITHPKQDCPTTPHLKNARIKCSCNHQQHRTNDPSESNRKKTKITFQIQHLTIRTKKKKHYWCCNHTRSTPRHPLCPCPPLCVVAVSSRCSQDDHATDTNTNQRGWQVQKSPCFVSKIRDYPPWNEISLWKRVIHHFGWRENQE